MGTTGSAAGGWVGRAIAVAASLRFRLWIRTNAGRMVGRLLVTVTATPRALAGNWPAGQAPNEPTVPSGLPVGSTYTADMPVAAAPLAVVYVVTAVLTLASQRLSLASSDRTCQLPARLAASAAPW